MTLLLATYAMVLARAFQQLNVMHHRVLWVAPCSAVMALMEVTIVLRVVATGWWSAIPMAVGGSLGCITAMYLHQWLRARK